MSGPAAGARPAPGPAGIALAGITLPDARSGQQVDLGSYPALGLLVLIRHRH